MTKIRLPNLVYEIVYWQLLWPENSLNITFYQNITKWWVPWYWPNVLKESTVALYIDNLMLMFKQLKYWGPRFQSFWRNVNRDQLLFKKSTEKHVELILFYNIIHAIFSFIEFGFSNKFLYWKKMQHSQTHFTGARLLFLSFPSLSNFKVKFWVK